MKTLDFKLRLLLKSLLILFVFNFQFSQLRAQVSFTFYCDTVVQNFLVPTGVTTMTITAVGAMGGGSGSDTYAAGYGASVAGKCTVTPGHNLSIVVGHQGYTSAQLNSGGGGGASFVFDSNNATIFVIAGGGGGEGFSFTAGGANGGNGGIIYLSPYTPTTSPQGCGAIVSGGHGGNRGTYSTDGNGPGAGGTGWTFNGDSVGGGSHGDPEGGPLACGGGKDKTYHFKGGSALSYGPDVNYGGYGGGGGGGYNGGGGGGGYNGGSGGDDPGNGSGGGGGGGGGSYLHGTIVGTPTATNDSNGYVIISYSPPPVSVTAAATTNVSCRSGNNGKATATARNGNPPYTYSWSNGQTNTVATGLTAGSYTITVKDNINASATAAVTITQPALALAITMASHVNISCRGTNTGSATANAATGGTSPYTYAWAPSGGTGLTASNLSANTYTISVTDNHGCTATASVNITQPATGSSIAIISSTNINCYGNNTGSVTASAATGGISPYTYTWAPTGGTGLTASNLSANTYTITATDNQGCPATVSVALTQPASAVSVSISSEADALCYGSDGLAFASASGGTGTLTYSWNDANATVGPTLSAVAGTYVVTVTDSNGCAAIVPVIIGQPASAVNVSISSSSNILCYGNNGSATASASGGEGAITYSWNDANSTAGPTLFASAGNYIVTASDTNGCTATASVTISQPLSALAVSISSETNVLCYGNNGSALASASGGTGAFTYSWNDANTTTVASLTAIAGNYIVTVKDANGCSATAAVAITQPSAPVAVSILSWSNVLCHGNNGSATAIAGGGTGTITYKWNDANSTSGASLSAIAGTYTVTAKDANGCIATAAVTITQPATAVSVSISSSSNPLCYGNNGAATATANGGTGTITYKWNDANSSSGATLSAIAGTYTVTAKDANGCTATVAVTITQPATAVTVSISSSYNPLCYGSNGSATANASGGTGTITYKWNDANSSSGAILSAIAGTYTVTAKDANGCIATAAITITQPATAVNVSISSSVNPLCHGNNGAATASASGGTGTITYKWNDANSTSGASLSAIAGTYTVTAKDANGCTATAVVTITQPASAVSVNISSSSNPLCYGNNGTAIANASGGTGTITYKWNDANSSSGATLSAIAGTYTVTAKDANGCTATASVTITQPSTSVSVSISSETDALCYGNNGSATASANGGTGTITYKWNDANSSGGATLSAIAGTYTVTAKDANGCTATTSITILQPASAVIVSITSETNAMCYGGSGSAAAIASGGTGTITYKWNDANSTAGVTLSALAGTYTVTAKDANGCTATASVTIGQPGAFTTTVTILANPPCNGNTNGNASANTTGGSSPYTYKWSNGTTTVVSTANPTGAILPAHGYTLTVTDNHGCTATASVTITQPLAIRDSTLNVTNASCSNNGTATLGVKYGTVPYTYLWSPGGMTTATVGSLGAQTYTATVIDNHGCAGTARKVTITNIGSTLRDSVSLILNIGCNGGNSGEISIGTRGGIAPYTYLWNNGNTSYSASNLTAGSYSVTITDNNGCSNSLTSALTQPATALAATQASITYPECHGGKGSASVSASGGTPAYKYAWAPITNTTASSTNLTAGTYTVTVSDAHGCKSLVTIIITQPNAIRDTIVSAAKVNVNCNGQNNGSATVGIKYGTAPYTYSWSNGKTTATATGLSAGVYSVTVMDINGCSGTTATVTITQPSALSESIGAATCTNNLVKATVTAAGGTSPYTYLWSPGGGTKATMSSLPQGVYTVTVTDKHGCFDTLSKNLTCTAAIKENDLNKGTPPECCGGLDNIMIYPNPNNGQFTISASGLSVVGEQWSVEIYNVLGQKVYSQTAIPVRTVQPGGHEPQSTVNISDQPNGIYLIRILDNRGNLVSQKKVVKTN